MKIFKIERTQVFLSETKKNPTVLYMTISCLKFLKISLLPLDHKHTGWDNNKPEGKSVS